MITTDHQKSLPKKPEPFFLGYSKRVPRGLGLFFLLVITGFVAGMAATALFGASSIPDSGNGQARWDLGRQELFGRLEYTPYPVLRVPARNGAPARAYMLSGLGKVGVIARGRPLQDLMVRADGIMLNRGDLSMLQVMPDHMGLLNAEDFNVADYYPPARVKLGKWRLTGEICDGKCYGGAMRPGRGLAHKACANLCLFDGAPPVFVSEGPVGGRNFFMLADQRGRLLDQTITPFVGLLVTAEGEIEQVDDLMIFRMDLDTVKVGR
ncbi:MAG: hypothetical protein H2045_02490 [Rhizobiales bacterium]|nr:hypothetical protein [Hyphomicrobiales bacterium]